MDKEITCKKKVQIAWSKWLSVSDCGKWQLVKVLNFSERSWSTKPPNFRWLDESTKSAKCLSTICCVLSMIRGHEKLYLTRFQFVQPLPVLMPYGQSYFNQVTSQIKRQLHCSFNSSTWDWKFPKFNPDLLGSRWIFSGYMFSLWSLMQDNHTKLLRM